MGWIAWVIKKVTDQIRRQTKLLRLFSAMLQTQHLMEKVWSGCEITKLLKHKEERTCSTLGAAASSTTSIFAGSPEALSSILASRCTVLYLLYHWLLETACWLADANRDTSESESTHNCLSIMGLIAQTYACLSVLSPIVISGAHSQESVHRITASKYEMEYMKGSASSNTQSPSLKAFKI